MKKIVFLSLLSLLMFSGCRYYGGGVIVDGSYAYNSHAPAHGHRSNFHRYHYYPYADIYFDTGRNMYFYLDNHGQWSFSVNLPIHLHSRLNYGYVEFESEAERPYLKHQHYRNKYRNSNYRSKYKFRKNYKNNGGYKNGYKKEQRYQDKKYPNSADKYRNHDRYKNEDRYKNKDSYRNKEKYKDKYRNKESYKDRTKSNNKYRNKDKYKKNGNDKIDEKKYDRKKKDRRNERD